LLFQEFSYGAPWQLHLFLLWPFLNLFLNVREQATHLLYIVLINLQAATQLALTFRTFLSENMTHMGLSALKTALTCPAETLSGAPVGLHLGHVISIY
jgi:hypothetical protein